MMQIFVQLDNQAVQAQVKNCILLLSVKLDLNCLEVAGYEGL